ncbi:MAG: hypothetical protein AAF456_05600 [Planctomycetota bacterium]
MANTDTTEGTISANVELDAKTIDASQPFVGQWNNIISTTNWEKGRLICRWREALQDSGSASKDWSDEAWSQLVGGVTPQHVGRLRRTHERYGHVHEDYKGLFWSHFYAALDWEDAEMWLEGAVQNSWSISQMRHQRWETLGKIPEDQPQDSDIVVSETQEETQSLALSDRVRNDDREFVEGPRYEGPDFGDEDSSSGSSGSDRYEDVEDDEDTSSQESKKGVRLFESFTDLPDDISEAASAFKIAIIRHRTDEWAGISRDDCLGLLDALKELAKA